MGRGGGKGGGGRNAGESGGAVESASRLSFLRESLRRGDIVITASRIADQDFKTADGGFVSKRVSFGMKKWLDYYNVTIDGKTTRVKSLDGVYKKLYRYLNKTR